MKENVLEPHWNTKKMTDDFPNQLRKQFSIDRVLENPGFVAAVYVNERDHAADIIEDQQKRIEELEAALRKIAAIEDEHINVPKTEEGAHLWTALAMCVELAEAVLQEKKDEQ